MEYSDIISIIAILISIVSAVVAFKAQEKVNINRYIKNVLIDDVRFLRDDIRETGQKLMAGKLNRQQILSVFKYQTNRITELCKACSFELKKDCFSKLKSAFSEYKWEITQLQEIDSGQGEEMIVLSDVSHTLISVRFIELNVLFVITMSEINRSKHNGKRAKARNLA